MNNTEILAGLIIGVLYSIGLIVASVAILFLFGVVVMLAAESVIYIINRFKR